jgi:thioesterase domain-containing protein
MDYTRPIDTHFDAITMPVDPDTWRRFLSGLERRGKSRIHIRAVLQTGDQICGEFSGAFVALSS